jgi:hypothetical protein
MKTYKELTEKIDRQYTADYTLSKSGRKVHRTPLVDKDAEKVDEEKNIEVTMKSGHKFTAPIKVSGQDWHIVKHPTSGKQYRVDHKGNTLEEETISEGAYEKSEENKRSADAAKSQGNMFDHHLHMSDYHDNLAQWHSEKGRHSVADSHAKKSEEHHEKAMGLKEGYYGGKQRSAAWHADGGANDEGWDDKPSKQADQPHAVHINGKKWKSFGSQSHAQNVAKKIKGATVHKEEVEMQEQAPVAPVPDRKYIKGTPEHKAYKATKKPINGMPTNKVQEVLSPEMGAGEYIKDFQKSDAPQFKGKSQEKRRMMGIAAYMAAKKDMNEEAEQIDEKSEQAKRNKTMKNMMDASRGARYKVQNKVSADDVRDWDGKHPTPRAQNVAIGRALRNEAKDETPPFDGPYTKTPGTVKDKSGAVHTPMSRARDLARQAMKKQMKEDIDLFFEAKDESEYGYEGDMAISQLKTICRHAEEFMGMLKPDTDLPEWVQSKITLATDYIQTAHDYMSSEMNEELKGNQHKIDKNKNGKVDSHDFKMLRGEVCPECGKSPCECGTVKESGEIETRSLSFGQFMSQLNEYNPGPGGVTRIQGRSYGAQYRDPEGEDDADDKKKQVAKSEPAVKRGRGRPAGSKSGANQKVTTGKKGSGVDYTGYKLHLPNSNR